MTTLNELAVSSRYQLDQRGSKPGRNLPTFEFTKQIIDYAKIFGINPDANLAGQLPEFMKLILVLAPGSLPAVLSNLEKFVSKKIVKATRSLSALLEIVPHSFLSLNGINRATNASEQMRKLAGNPIDAPGSLPTVLNLRVLTENLSKISEIYALNFSENLKFVLKEAVLSLIETIDSEVVRFQAEILQQEKERQNLQQMITELQNPNLAVLNADEKYRIAKLDEYSKRISIVNVRIHDLRSSFILLNSSKTWLLEFATQLGITAQEIVKDYSGHELELLPNN